jgi:hypothetical protein
MLISRCHGDVGISIRPDMCIMEVRVPCESRLISKQDATFTTRFARSHWQNTALARWWVEVRVCTRWMWYGQSDCSCRILQTVGTPIPLAPEIVRTVVPGSSCALLYTRTSRKLAHMSAGIDFWPYVDGDFCSFQWVLCSLKACNPFLVPVWRYILSKQARVCAVDEGRFHWRTFANTLRIFGFCN